MHNFIRLLKLCKPHAGMLLLGAFLASLTVLANVGLLAISGWFLAAMAAAGILDLLDQDLPPFIVAPAVTVTANNVVEAWMQSLNIEAPESVR